jgi:UDP-N-acetylmuramoyl-L-alanyl-D-glutamate--2,6-diaminopimelate ligase
MRLVKLTPAKLISYALKKEADFKATNISLNLAGAEFIITTAYGDCRIETNLIGHHNIYNVLAAVALAVHEGLDLEVIREGIKNFKFVPGRLEEVKKEGLPFRIFVDYAHTEDAMRNVLSALRTFCSGKIVLVFGCGGDRDRDKRPKMGKLATEMADFIFITSDNPRSEDPLKICQEIASGIKNDNYRIVLDRFEAIKEAVTFLEPSDILLIAGKGHEANQIFKDRVIPFDDRKVLREILDGIYG